MTNLYIYIYRYSTGWWLSPTPLKNDGVKVSWDYEIPNIYWKIKKNVLKPLTSYVFLVQIPIFLVKNALNHQSFLLGWAAQLSANCGQSCDPFESKVSGWASNFSGTTEIGHKNQL